MTNNISLERLPFHEQTYVPVKEFMSTLREISFFPYPSAFSLEPLVELYKARVSDLGIHPESLDTKLKSHNLKDLKKDSTEISKLLGEIMPELLVTNELLFIAPPFNLGFLFHSAPVQDLFFSDDWELKIPQQFHEFGANNNIFQACTLILNQFYGFEIEDWINKPVLTLRNRHNGLERHFRMRIDCSSVQINALKPIPKYSREELHQVFRKATDPEVWINHFPPDHFSFEGFTLGYIIEVTKPVAINHLKETFSSDHLCL